MKQIEGKKYKKEEKNVCKKKEKKKEEKEKKKEEAKEQEKERMEYSKKRKQDGKEIFVVDRGNRVTRKKKKEKECEDWENDMGIVLLNQRSKCEV